ncbi:TPA: ABC transporter ATP-binding protein [Clostridioides difficile]|uniref:ABC transporter ATP-binding protein n=1 Tax=Clostridioides difficile TaxID=1496 RepID=UPI00093B38BF|nr:ABC transporter ATP-binding protein [Clostridioides difficile]EII6782842.1 ABC transporter ATP-binding protein [Clostridioides difficile]MBY2208048.1 ABC transporter ATP-binding protein [Clostridioides difficile]MBZ0593711.1 ABC transporter ATP-binding protein [Clostridioides difficile]MCL6886658.1 ABC transporter ATP-binding protein [Clostridioides difficile]MCR1643135.1 ABC transporter ATP-binding protein [Clostridioides difficile]
MNQNINNVSQDGIVEFKGVNKSYGTKNVLKNIDLNIPKGKIVGLLGPNGSGKSTMIKLMNGLLQPDNGEIMINGIKPSIETKKIVSYLPERTYLNDWMKVSDLLKFFYDFYSDFDVRRANEMIKSLDIDVNEKLKTMSKGTKEKVQLILVMSRNASIYILDEPIGGVDPAARSYILKTILKNYSEDSTLLIATHLISEIENICDEVIFISKGEIVLQGDVEAIREEKGKSIDALFREEFKC